MYYENTNIRRIVIVGGGFGGIYTLKNLHKIFHNKNEIKVTLVNENNYFLFTPLLHEIATGNINPENAIEPIQKVLGCCIDNLVVGKVLRIDNKNKKIETTEGMLDYDYLVLAPGAETNFYDIQGAEKYSYILKNLNDAIEIKNNFIDTLQLASKMDASEERRNLLRFVVVGGGPTGVEMVSEMQEFLKGTFSKYYNKELINDVSVILVHSGEELLPQFPKSLRGRALRILKRKGIEVRLNTKVVEVFEDGIKFVSREELKTKNVIWVTGIKPTNLIFEEETLKDENGRIVVNKFLQTKNYSEIFAIGDVASFYLENGEKLPALAQVAVKQSNIVAQNIKKIIYQEDLMEYKHRSPGVLVSLGKWNALGEIYKFVIEGKFAWWLWRTVYLFKLISWQKKLKVVTDWTINIFSARDISRL